MVPDLSAPEVILSTPRVWFARNAREFTALTAGAPPAPTATREFRRTDRLLVRLDAYAPANAPTTVTAQLLNQQGTKMIDVPVKAPAAAGESYSIDLPLASFAPGSTCWKSPRQRRPETRHRARGLPSRVVKEASHGNTEARKLLLVFPKWFCDSVILCFRVRF